MVTLGEPRVSRSVDLQGVKAMGVGLKTPHLAASLVALGIVALILVVGSVGGRALERRYLHPLASRLFLQKNQGVALQRAAFAEPDLLPFYGSSELVRPASYKAADFFRTYPTGFNVFPIARVGATSLVIFEKLAAVGSGVRGRKVAISVSPSWFFRQSIPQGYYNGNFSRLQADELIYGAPISLELKRDAARRMLRYPETLQKDVLLAFALRQLAADSPLHDLLFYATAPLGYLEKWILRMQDHFETLIYILRQRSHLQSGVRRLPRALDWHALIEQSASEITPQRVDIDPEPVGPEAGPEAFTSAERDAHEWIDLELLLRGLNELGARPLLLSMPIDGRYFDRFGVGRPVRDLYYKRIRGLAQAHHVPLIDFAERDEDQGFLAGHHDHLSSKGWLYYDKALDDFFHDRLATPPGA
ncbi:MAG: D-alanyl-lipoteichoic acid biosynthesis protein DltD [Verrucomicrobia bacterium]|nr:D-alanyl-lipoteichoic acid biosynthesis protein DltD [Verrucomicrobiota bacterium]